MKHVTEKQTGFAPETVKGSQFKQPLLEFSGACAGCVETAYARLITQLFGDRMSIANATGCSSIWGGSAPAAPYTINKDGRGPSWANSLFEDNAEFGLGIAIATRQLRERLAAKVQKVMEGASGSLKEACQNYLDTLTNSAASRKATDALVPELEKAAANGCELSKEILKDKDFLAKRSVWIFGGDGWAYDIGYGGVDHVLASGEDVNIMVFDTEVYSNTGGQASKASQIGQVAQFAAAGKKIKKKDLAAISMTYGYIYVAQIGMGANYQQTVRALVEAESYNGPSLVIGYAPCEMHGIKGGMGNSQLEIKAAVEAGYWHLFRYDPRLKEEGKNPFQLDSKAPKADYEDFIKREVRYTALARSFPEKAEGMYQLAAEEAKKKYDRLVKRAEENWD